MKLRTEHQEEEARKDSQLQTWSKMPEGKARDARRHTSYHQVCYTFAFDRICLETLKKTTKR